MDDLLNATGLGELERLEQALESLLTPVTPRADFVHALENRLVEGEARAGRRMVWVALVGLLGLAGGLFVIARRRRTFVRYLESLGRVRRGRWAW